MEQQNLQVATLTSATLSIFDPVQFENMQRIAQVFANSELVPDTYKISGNNPEKKAIANVMVALELAQRIGASPLAIMQNMVPIYGRPSWSSKFLISTVNTCGRFRPLRFKFEDRGMIGKIEYTEYTTNWDNGKKKITALS